MKEAFQAEYIQANRMRLDHIGERIEACFSTETPEVERAVIVPDRVPMITLETPALPDEWLADDPELSPDEAIVRTAAYNKAMTDRILSSKDCLLTWATRAHTGESNLLRQLLVGDTPPDLLHYDTAEWRELTYEWYSDIPDSDRIDVRVASIALKRLHIWDSAKAYAIRAGDNDLHKTLTLRYLHDELCDVSLDISPAQSGLIRRLIDMFGEDAAQLMVWTSGAFHNKAELDAGLATFVAGHPHIPARAQQDLLAQVRAEGIAANQAMDIEGPELFLPDANQLDEFIGFLE